MVKLWAPGRGELARYATPIQVGTAAYHLKVVTSGTNIKAYLNDKAEAVIDFFDATPVLNGLFGLNVYNGTGVFQNVIVDGGAVGLSSRTPVAMNASALTVMPASNGSYLSIQYRTVDQAAKVSLQIFDLQGNLVRTLVEGKAAAGLHSVTFDGNNNRGQAVASGKYLCRLRIAPVAANGTVAEHVVSVFSLR
jgi:hypothetical protein